MEASRPGSGPGGVAAITLACDTGDGARLSRLEAEPLREVTTWLARYQMFWDESHERLDELLAALPGERKDGPGRRDAARAKGTADESDEDHRRVGCAADHHHPGVALGAVESLRRGLARELGRDGIRVVTLQTGGIPETLPAGFEGRQAIADDIAARTMLGRPATLADVGRVAAFAASGQAAAITGSAINITCGSVPG